MDANQRKEIESKEYRLKVRNCVPFATSEAGCAETQAVMDYLESALDAAEARAAELQAENESLKRRVQDEIRRSDDSMAHYVAAELRTKDAKARAVAAEERVGELEWALRRIACYDDAEADERLTITGSYGAFDEPVSVQLARKPSKHKGVGSDGY